MCPLGENILLLVATLERHESDPPASVSHSPASGELVFPPLRRIPDERYTHRDAELKPGGVVAYKLSFGGLFAVAMLSMAPIRSARAASFDCATAKSLLEKQICADATLSRADEVMGTVYRAQMSATPLELRQRLRASQRSWLAYIDPYCSIPAKDRPVCLRDGFMERTEELQKTISQVGPLKFFQSWTYAVGFSDVRADRAFTHHTSFLQIARPESPAEREWNQMAATNLKGAAVTDEPEDDLDASAQLSGVSADLISARFGTSYYSGGMAHPQSSSHGVVWSLRLRRALTFSDLFRDVRAGKALLATRALAHFDGGEIPDGATLATVLDSLEPRPGHGDRVWEATPAGVVLGYDPYAFGCYPCTGRAVVPWPELAPYLRSDLPFSIKDIRADRERH